jgi:hypothetical protein
MRRRGSGSAGAAAIPPRPGQTGRAAGPFAALSLRSERLLGAGSLRRLANAVPARNPSTIAVRTSGPTCPWPTGPSPTSESACVRHGRRPTSPPAGFPPYTATKRVPAPTGPSVTTARTSCPTGVCSKEVSPTGWAPSETTIQPRLIVTRTLPRISRFARRLEGPALDPAGLGQAARAACMYDVAGAAGGPRERRAQGHAGWSAKR